MKIPAAQNTPIETLLGCEYDTDIKLAALGGNLQRGLVWSDAQKTSYITSLLQGYSVGSMMISRKGKIYQVIDGKQRLDAIAWYAKQLSAEALSEFHLVTVPVVHLTDEPTDLELMSLFLVANPPIVPQDIGHLATVAAAVATNIAEQSDNPISARMRGAALWAGIKHLTAQPKLGGITK